MSAAQERRNRTMLQVRDRLDREYADPLDLRALALGVHYSPDHLVRSFRETWSRPSDHLDVDPSISEKAAMTAGR